LDLRFLEGIDHLVSRPGVRNQNVEIRCWANAPASYNSEFAVVNNCDLAPRVFHHRGIELRLVGNEATNSVFRINAIRTDEQGGD